MHVNDPSSPRAEREFPLPPRKGWPLRAHPNGQWYKQHRGKRYYFGPWDEDWRKAEADYNWRWPAIVAGKPDPKFHSPANPDQVTLDELANLLLAERLGRLATAANSLNYWDQHNALKYLLEFAGAQGVPFRHRAAAAVPPEEWRAFRLRLEADYGPDQQRRWIGAVYRPLAKFAKEKYGLDLNTGSALNMVSRSEIRAARRRSERLHGPKLFPRAQIEVILNACHTPFDAMFLMGLNAGFGATDLAYLPTKAVDLKECFFDYDRVKTGVQRAGFLWPITVERLKTALANRPPVNAAAFAKALAEWESRKPEGREAIRRWELRRPDWESLFFLSPTGQPWVRCTEADHRPGKEAPLRTDGITKEFYNILTSLDEKFPQGVGGWPFKRRRVRFYAARHTFYSAAKRVDPDAAKFIMGHADEEMGEWYDHLDEDKLQLLFDVAAATGERLLPDHPTAPHTSLLNAARRSLRSAGTEGTPAKGTAS